MTGSERTGLLDARVFRDYLLGALSDAEMEAAEERYFADGGVLAECEQVEDDLIDDYLSGRLDATQREQFETHYLVSPTRRERYEIARALRRRSPQLRSTRRTIQVGALAAGVALVSITFYLVNQRQNTPPPTPSVLASLTLPAIQLRSDQKLPTAQLTPSTSELELRLERGERPLEPPLEVEIRSLAGIVVWSGPATPADDAGSRQLLAVVRVPTDRLIEGDYILELRSLAGAGRAEADRYPFRVARR